MLLSILQLWLPFLGKRWGLNFTFVLLGKHHVQIFLVYEIFIFYQLSLYILIDRYFSRA